MNKTTLNSQKEKHSTLSLRRATPLADGAQADAAFLSTLSLRRATRHWQTGQSRTRHFYPRSPCGERHLTQAQYNNAKSISIHALLAESDGMWATAMPCGMRFLSTLSLRRATSRTWRTCCTPQYFYPRSPCGERLFRDHRAAQAHSNFYPRSPCGERRTAAGKWTGRNRISIHALLAESDATNHDQGANNHLISIHALLAESDCSGRTTSHR